MDTLEGLLAHAAKGAVTVGVAKGASGQGVAVVNLIIRRWARSQGTALTGALIDVQGTPGNQILKELPKNGPFSSAMFDYRRVSFWMM